MQQLAEENTFDEDSRAARLVGTQELHANLEQALLGQPSGAVSLSSNIVYKVPKSDVTLTSTWADDKSLNKPMPSLWATFQGVLARKPEMPEFSFWQTGADGQAALSELPLGHTRFEVIANRSNKTGVSTFSQLFPYGLYSPSGNIVADSVAGFTNAVGYQSSDSAVMESGRPVDLYAQGDITVTNSFTSGRARSRQGKITLPDGDGQGAIPLGGQPAPHDQWSALLKNLETLQSTIAAQTLNKTEFLDDQLFTLAHLKDIFSGNAQDLLSIFSVGQACKVPFFPIPAVQDDAPLMVVVYILHPYPVDFSGTARDTDTSNKLKQVAAELSEKQSELKQKQQELADEQAKPKPDQSKIDELKGDISTLQDDISNLKKQAKELSDQLAKDKDDISKHLSQGKIPQTAAEDSQQVTKGWSYLFVIDDLLKIVVDLLSGKDPFEALFAPTRVVHFGDMGPDWQWDGNTIDMKANLTVPRGRSLKISKPHVKVRGDVYLQDGATLYIDGDLTVEQPDGWTDFKGVPASDYGGYPNGRIIMEEGANLIVSGSLHVTGGDYNNGSVMLSSEYGPNHGITSLIYAGSDISLRYGMMPAVTLGDLVDQLAVNDPALKGFNDDFFRPLTEQAFTIIGRLPYGGPWQWRPSYFAKYATTFEFIPLLEEFGLGGPWPIPLPFDNCLTKVFKYLSIVYAVELNAFTGENFYTHSPFWPLGRGVTPVVLKVNPELVRESLGGLQWGKITLDSLKDVGLNFLKDVLPQFALNVVQNIITEVVKQAVLSEIPFKPPTCGDSENSDTNEAENVVKAFVNENLQTFGKAVKRSFMQVLLTMKNEVYDNLDSGQNEYSYLRQLPGLVVAAGGGIDIGAGVESRLALGLLLARGDVNVGSEKTIGVVVSTGGNIEVNNFLHYPYFERASLYDPKKYSDIFSSLVEFGDPTGVCAGDIAQTYPHRLAEGWK